MPQLINTQKIFVGGYDISAFIKTMALEASVEELDATVLGDTTRKNHPGLPAAGFSCDGFWQAGASGIDTIAAGYKGTADVPVTICSVDGSVGTVAESLLTFEAQLNIGGAVGDLHPISLAFSNTSEKVRGEILYNATATADVSGTAVELGAITATEALTARLHVFGGGTALAVKIQSDSTATFGSPTDVVTFTALATTVVQTYQAPARVTATNADTFWRITATAAAGRAFAVFAGIQTR